MTPAATPGVEGFVAGKPTGSIADVANEVNLLAVREDIAASLAKARELIRYARERAQTMAGLYPFLEGYLRNAESAASQAEFNVATTIGQYQKNPEPRNPV